MILNKNGTKDYESNPILPSTEDRFGKLLPSISYNNNNIQLQQTSIVDSFTCNINLEINDKIYKINKITGGFELSDEIKVTLKEAFEDTFIYKFDTQIDTNNLYTIIPLELNILENTLVGESEEDNVYASKSLFEEESNMNVLELEDIIGNNPTYNSEIFSTYEHTILPHSGTGYFGYAIYVDENNIYIGSYSSNKVDVFDKDYNHITTITPHEGTGNFGSSIYVDENYIYIGSRTASKVDVFDKDYNYITTITPHEGTGSFGRSIFVDENYIYIGSLTTNKVEVFDKDYNYITNILSHEGNVYFGSSIHVDENNIYVGSERANKVEVFDKDYNHITTITPHEGTGYFGSSIYVDENNIYIGSYSSNKVDVFDKYPNALISTNTIFKQIQIDTTKFKYLVENNSELDVNLTNVSIDTLEKHVECGDENTPSNELSFQINEDSTGKNLTNKEMRLVVPPFEYDFDVKTGTREYTLKSFDKGSKNLDESSIKVDNNNLTIIDSYDMKAVPDDTRFISFDINNTGDSDIIVNQVKIDTRKKSLFKVDLDGCYDYDKTILASSIKNRVLTYEQEVDQDDWETFNVVCFYDTSLRIFNPIIEYSFDNSNYTTLDQYEIDPENPENNSITYDMIIPENKFRKIYIRLTETNFSNINLFKFCPRIEVDANNTIFDVDFNSVKDNLSESSLEDSIILSSITYNQEDLKSRWSDVKPIIKSEIKINNEVIGNTEDEYLFNNISNFVENQELYYIDKFDTVQIGIVKLSEDGTNYKLFNKNNVLVSNALYNTFISGYVDDSENKFTILSKEGDEDLFLDEELEYLGYKIERIYSNGMVDSITKISYYNRLELRNPARYLNYKYSTLNSFDDLIDITLKTWKEYKFSDLIEKDIEDVNE